MTAATTIPSPIDDPFDEAPVEVKPIDRSEAPPVRLIAIDVDGTLLRSDRQLSHATANVLAAASYFGVRIVLASARPPRSVRQIAENLDCDAVQIHYNGAMILDRLERKVLYHQPIAPKLAWKIVKAARRIDRSIHVSAEIEDRWCTDGVAEEFPTETSRHFEPDVVGPLKSFMDQPVTKLMLAAPPDKLGRVRAALQHKFGAQARMLLSDPYLLQIVHPSVDKAAALQWVANHYNIGREHVMAIGDAPNDVGMLQWAGFGVAMANAWPAARKAADALAPSNDEDGVAWAIKTYVLEE